MADRIFRLRVTYSIDGRLSMLSHLETARALERIVRRAHLPFAVTNGFSPHMKIAFGGALPVGVGGDAEIFDIFLTDYIAPQTVLEALQSASPESMPVRSCIYIEASAPAASVAYPVSVYEAVFNCPMDDIQPPSEVSVMRKGKEKTLHVADYLVDGPHLSEDTVRFALEAKPTGSLRPDVFLKECACASGKSPLSESLAGIRRVAQYGDVSALRRAECADA